LRGHSFASICFEHLNKHGPDPFPVEAFYTYKYAVHQKQRKSTSKKAKFNCRVLSKSRQCCSGLVGAVRQKLPNNIHDNIRADLENRGWTYVSGKVFRKMVTDQNAIAEVNAFFALISQNRSRYCSITCFE
jgi:hypothetical protein